MTVVLLWVLCLLLGPVWADEEETGPQAESKFRNELFDNYAREMVPRSNRSELVNISTIVYLKRVEPHKNFMITIQGTFIFSWKDEFLVYADKNPLNIKSIRVMTHEIWVPDITVFNVEGTPHVLNHQAVCYLFASGKVSCKRRFSLDMYCKMDYALWPHDTQVCSFYFGTWIEYRAHLVAGGPGKKGFYLMMSRNSPRWIVKNITVIPENYEPGKVSNYFEYVFELQRKDENHFTTFVTPAIIISVLSLLTFWLPRDRGVTRISVALVALTINALFIQDLGFSILGWSGDTVPRIVQFYRDEMVMNLFSMLITAIVRILSAWQGSPGAFFGVLASVLMGSKVSRLFFDLGAKAKPSQALAALLDRCAFFVACGTSMWMIANLVPPAEP